MLSYIYFVNVYLNRICSEPANLNKFISIEIIAHSSNVLNDKPTIMPPKHTINSGLVMNHNNVNIPHLAFSLRLICSSTTNKIIQNNIFIQIMVIKFTKGHSHSISLLLCTKNTLSSCFASKWTILGAEYYSLPHKILYLFLPRAFAQVQCLMQLLNFSKYSRMEMVVRLFSFLYRTVRIIFS